MGNNNESGMPTIIANMQNAAISVWMHHQISQLPYKWKICNKQIMILVNNSDVHVLKTHIHLHMYMYIAYPMF